MKRLSLTAALLAALLLSSAVPADERSTARRFEAAKRDEPSLIAFLRTMPKGGDLHNHAGGSLFAEHGLEQAVKHGLFFNPATNRFEAEKQEGSVPADQLRRDDRLRYQYLNTASVRGAGQVAGGTRGHDLFFGAFGPASSGWQKTPVEEALAGLVRRARLQNLQYLELMQAPDSPVFERLRAAVSPGDPPERMLQKIRPLLPEYVRDAREQLDRWDRVVAEKAGVPAPLTGPGGPVTVRYLFTGFRLSPDEPLFVGWAAGMALARADPRMVGINLAAPEDHPIAREAFDRQMRLLDFLWRHFDRPNVTLHAGELNLLLSPLEDMTDHIRKSIEIGHARRIGHGTAIAWEDDPHGLMRKMKEEGIAVEICPSSEAVILGAEGDRHPFRLYHRAGVPMTINTDDEAILRSNLTMEFVRAVRSWNLSYPEVKELVRNSLRYSFLPGEGLFEGRGYGRLRRPFRGLRERGWQPAPAHSEALKASPKAAVQLRLEQALREFEGP